MTSNNHFDVIVIGGGPGGSTAATLLSQKGLKVALLEKETFPRFKIGESLLPYSMDILKESGVFSKIDSGKYIRKYGASFIDYRESEPVYFEFTNGLDNEHPYAFEVTRADFDNDLLDHAIENGVKVFQPFNAREINFNQDSVEIKNSDTTLSCKYIIDATGRNAVLGSMLQNREINSNFNGNIAIYSHFKNVKRNSGKKEGDIIAGILPNNSWSWHIPFKGDITSVGIVCNSKVYNAFQNKENFIIDQLNQHSFFKDHMENAIPTGETSVTSNYSYNSKKKIGDRWVMIGDAAAFIDPIFSSGVHISLVSAQLSAELVASAFSKNELLTENSFGSTYSEKLQKGADRFQSLILLFYNYEFTQYMKKTMDKKSLFRSFTSAVSGDMWNEDNLLFRMGVLGKGSAFNEKPRTL